jgi:hypothetical protein
MTKPLKAAQSQTGTKRMTTKNKAFFKWAAGVFTVCGPLISAGPAFCQTAADENSSASAAADQLNEIVATIISFRYR